MEEIGIPMTNIMIYGGKKMTNRGIFRNFVWMLTAALLLGLLAACSGGNDNNNQPAASSPPTSDGPSQSASQTPAEPVKFQMLTWNYELLQNALQFKPLQQAANVEIELMDGGDRDTVYFQNVEMKLASNDLPDVLAVNMEQADIYGPQGAFLDWTAYLDQAPNIKKFMEENPDFKRLATASDGKIYALPNEQPSLPWLLWMYREDVFAKYQLKPPTNKDELLQTLRTLRQQIPDKDFYPISVSDMFLFWIGFKDMFGAGAQTPGPDGKLTGHYFQFGGGSDLFSPGYKEMIEFVKTMYDERLIDPETINGSHNEDAWGAKMLNGKAVMTVHGVGRPNMFTVEGKKINPEYAMVPMPPLADNKGEQFYYPAAQFNGAWSMAISAKAKNPEGIVKFFDYLYSEEGKAFRGWGVKGETFEETDGKKQFKLTFEEEEKKGLKVGDPRWHLTQTAFFLPMPAENDAAGLWLPETQKTWTPEYQAYLRPVPQFKVTGDALKEISDINAKLTPQLDAQVNKFITGKRPMSEWDNFLTEMEKLGYKRVTELYQQAWDAVK